MNDFIDKEQLQQLARSIKSDSSCPSCSSLNCVGWESLPAVFDKSSLKLIGTLKIEGAAESWDEYHPNGTQIWSVDAPIAIGFHPYNRCDVYQCIKCAKPYLRYTEFGGYYVDERIRVLSEALLVFPESPSQI